MIIFCLRVSTRSYVRSQSCVDFCCPYRSFFVYELQQSESVKNETVACNELATMAEVFEELHYTETNAGNGCSDFVFPENLEYSCLVLPFFCVFSINSNIVFKEKK